MDDMGVGADNVNSVVRSTSAVADTSALMTALVTCAVFIAGAGRHITVRYLFGTTFTT